MLPIIEFLSSIPGIVKLVDMVKKRLNKKEKPKKEENP